jgi:hypothetical protein
LTGRATKGTWGNLGRQKEKEMIIHKWISSDGSELVPTTDVEINLTLPSYLACNIACKQGVNLVIHRELILPVRYFIFTFKLSLDTYVI